MTRAAVSEIHGVKETETRPATVLLAGAEDEENLALRYLAGTLQSRGHKAVVVPCARETEIDGVAAAARESAPDILAISMAFQALAPLHFQLVERVRAAGYRGHIVVGGHFATFEYRRILESQPGIDSVGRFEGEATVAALADALLSGGDLSTVPGLAYRDGDALRENPCPAAYPDLDLLPFPLRSEERYVRLGESFATVVSSRGCWHSSCQYCCIGAFHRERGAKFALRSPESVAQEIASLVETRATRIIQFHDDNFMQTNRARTLERIASLSAALDAAGVRREELAYLIKARPDALDNDVAKALCDFGCVGVFLGIENASETGLDALRRGVTVEELHTAMGALRACGLAATYNLLIFHPAATLAEMDDNAAFIRAYPEVPMDFGRAEIVAASPLEHVVRERGLLRGEWPHWDYRLEDPEVERMCGIYRSVFRSPDTGYSSMSHLLIALAYHAAIVDRLCPSPTTARRALVAEAVRPWNLWLAGAIETMTRMARDGYTAEEKASFKEEVAARCSAKRAEVQALSESLLKSQRNRRLFRFFGVEDVLTENSRLGNWLGKRFG